MTTHLAVLVALATACSMGGRRPSYDYFVLTSDQPMPAEAPGGDETRALVVDQVSIPGYLDREQIAMRTLDHHLVYSPKDRWAEPLDQAFARTLREELAAELVPRGIQVRSHGGAPAYELDVDVLRFEQRGPQQVELWARWTLRKDTEVVDSGETRLRVAMRGTDANAMASALSTTVARMATQIADRVRAAEVVATHDRHGER